MTPELMIALADIPAKRKRKGKRWCRKKGIGAITRELGYSEYLGANVVPITDNTPLDPRVREFAEMREGAHAIVRAVCRNCPTPCRLGREKVA